MDIIINIVALACLTHLWVISEPTRGLRKLIGLDSSHPIKIIRVFTQFLECSLCSGFWLGLLFTGGSLYMAAIVSVLAEYIYRKL